MLQMVGAAVETDDDEGHMFETRMNMMQLAFIKRLDCVERVKTDEGINPFLAEEAEKPVSNQQKPRKDEASAEFSGEPEPAAQVVSLAADTVIADAAEAADGIAAASADPAP